MLLKDKQDAHGLLPLDAVTALHTGPRSRLLLVAVCTALFIEAMNVSIVSIVLPSIQREFEVSVALLQWVHSAFIVAFAGLLLFGGRAADLFGRRRMFIGGTAAFGFAAALCGLAESPVTLFLARGLQGAAAAFLVPAAVSILTTAFPEGPERNRALGAFNAAGAAGFSAGLVVGGFLTEGLGWRSAFLANVPVAFAIVGAALLAIPTDPRQGGLKAGVDLGGALTGVLAVSALVVAITQATEGGLSPAIVGLAAFSAMMAVLFVVIERRHSHALLPFRLFKKPSVPAANIASLTLLGSFFGFNLMLALLVQNEADFSPGQAGLALLPMSLLTVAVSQWLTPHAVNRFGPGPTAAAGLFACAAGAVLLATGASDPGYWAHILPASLLAGGVGMGLGYSALAVGAVAGVPVEDQGVAAGLQQTTLQIGGALGVALTVAVPSLADTLLRDGLRYDFTTALVAPIAIGLCGAVLSLRIK